MIIIMWYLIGYDILIMILDWYRIYLVFFIFLIGYFGVVEIVIFKIRLGVIEKIVKILFVYGRIRYYFYIWKGFVFGLFL